MAKLILTHEVSGLGEPGDVVEVKDGYARNYLIPRKLATPWSAGAEKQIDSIRAARKAREIATIEEAQAIKASLESKPAVVTARAGQGGRLFGAVTGSDIADAVAANGGPKIDKRKVEIANPIKSVGEFSASVRLHSDVSAQLTVQVVAAK